MIKIFLYFNSFPPASKCPASQKPLPSASRPVLMPHLNTFIPALHHSLAKVRCNPPSDLSAGVELQAREYLSGCKEGKVSWNVLEGNIEYRWSSPVNFMNLKIKPPNAMSTTHSGTNMEGTISQCQIVLPFSTIEPTKKKKSLTVRPLLPRCASTR